MTVGTTSDYNLGHNAIVESAYLKCRAMIQGQSLAPAKLARGIEALNLIVRSWQAQGLHLWTQSTFCLFLNPDQSSYTISSTGAHACDYSDFVDTPLSADEASGQTVISVTSSSGMTAGDYIGIELESGSRHWTTIVSVDSSTQVTITSALTGDAASGATVYTYTTRLAKMYRVYNDEMRRKDTSDNETIVSGLSRQDYSQLSQKTSSGVVNQLYYQPRRDDGIIQVWPCSNNCTDIILGTYDRDILDFDASGDYPDFPAEWTRTLIWCLAAEVGQEEGIPLDRQQYIEGKAAEMLDVIKGWDNDTYSVRIQPDMSECD